MRPNPKIALLAVAAAAPAALPATAPATSAAGAAAAVRQFEGTVVSVDRDPRRFRLHDAERGTVRIRVTRRTRFERIAGFRALERGMRNVEATVRRSDGRWIALEVERSGGGGEHGGDDDR
jgi:hypothetical protein